MGRRRCWHPVNVNVVVIIAAGWLVCRQRCRPNIERQAFWLQQLRYLSEPSPLVLSCGNVFIQSSLPLATVYGAPRHIWGLPPVRSWEIWKCNSKVSPQCTRVLTDTAGTHPHNVIILLTTQCLRDHFECRLAVLLWNMFNIIWVIATKLESSRLCNS